MGRCGFPILSRDVGDLRVGIGSLVPVGPSQIDLDPAFPDGDAIFGCQDPLTDSLAGIPCRWNGASFGGGTESRLQPGLA